MRWILLLVAVSITAVWVFSIPNEPMSDQGIYHISASRLADGLGYIDDSGNPTSYWAPGYIFYLAIFYLFFEPTLQVAFIANFIAYLALVAGVYKFASLAYSKRVGWMAAILTAFYPSLILYSTVIASEMLFSAFLVWTLVFIWLSFNKTHDKWGWFFLSGLSLGLTALIRPQALIFPVIVFAIGSARHARVWSSLWRFIGISLLTLLTCIPWGLRNQALLGEFVLVSANSGANLWIGNHEGSTGAYTSIDQILEDDNIRKLTLPERDKVLMKKALHYIYEHPGNFAWLAVKRSFITMRNESIAVVWNESGIRKRLGDNAIILLKLLTNISYFILLGVCLFYLYHHLRKWQFHSSDVIIFTTWFLLALPFLLFMGQDRFHLPLIPYMIIFAAKSYLTRLTAQKRI